MGATGLTGSPDRNAFSLLLRMIACTMYALSEYLWPTHHSTSPPQGALDRNCLGLGTFMTICRFR